MNQTVSGNRDAHATAICPANGRRYRQVPLRTVLHHVGRPWQRQIPEQGYYFCTDPECEVVYFGDDQQTLTRTDLRGPIGQKSTDPQRTICYCFGITAADALAPTDGGRDSRDYVIERTRIGDCACAIRNPSGRCCLGDFPGR